jgi:hypothetical protein
MTVSGERFLELCGARSFVISRHALGCLAKRTGRQLNREAAADLFLEAQQVTRRQMILLGYRPAYAARRSRGEDSWYFRIEVEGCEAVAVVGRGRQDGEYVWLTTYARNAQTEQLRLADWPAVASYA